MTPVPEILVHNNWLCIVSRTQTHAIETCGAGLGTKLLCYFCVLLHLCQLWLNEQLIHHILDIQLDAFRARFLKHVQTSIRV